MQNEFCFEVDDAGLANGKPTIAQRWADYHKRNPHIMEYLISMARQVRKGNESRKTGIAMLFEVMRWQYWLATESEEPYRLPNNFKPFYARAIMEAAPDLKGAFNLKKSMADEVFNNTNNEI